MRSTIGLLSGINRFYAQNTRCYNLTAVNIKTIVLWYVTTCSFVRRYLLLIIVECHDSEESRSLNFPQFNRQVYLRTSEYFVEPVSSDLEEHNEILPK